MLSNYSRKRERERSTQLPLHKQNYDKIIKLLEERVKMVSESNVELQVKYERMKNQLQYARPSDIRISSGDANQQDHGDEHNVLKKLVQAAISGQHNSTFDEKELQLFQRQNSEIENQISEKMKSIEDINQDIKQLQVKQEQAICELQKSEQSLKHILKSKGSLEQAERCEKEKKMRLVEVRSLREMLNSLKNKKINITKEVIECLNLLLQYRNQRMRKIEKMGKFGANNNKSPLQTQTKLLYEFVKNMEYLKQQKDKMQQDKRIYAGFNSFSNIHEFEQSTNHDNSNKKRLSSSNLSYNSTPKHSISGNMSCFMATQKKELQKKNNNQLSTKKLGNLNSTATFPIKSQIKSFKSFEQIIQAYEEVLQFMDTIKDAQLMYFKNRNDKLEQEYKVKAMEKSYLIGILGYNPVQSEKYERIVKFAIKKCVEFSQVINQKSEQRTNLQKSIKDVEQSSQIIKAQISSVLSQKQRKSSILASLQALIQQTSKQKKKPQIQELQQENEQIRTLGLQYIKEQEQFAEQGDFQNYKRVNIALEDLDTKKRQIEKKLKQEEQFQMKYCQNVYGHDNYQFWGKVRDLMGRYGVEMDVFRKIQAKTAAQLYAKFSKRLTSI